MILVNQGAATMLQTRETAAWQHEIMFCIVYLPFVELYIPQEIAVASKLTGLSRQGTWQQNQRRLVSASSQVKDLAPVTVMEPGSPGGPWPGLLSEAPGCQTAPAPRLSERLVNEWYWHQQMWLQTVTTTEPVLRAHATGLVFIYSGTFLRKEDLPH